MRLTIERAALLKALGHVQSVVERRNTIPILSNVLMAAERSGLALSATDLDMEIVDEAAASVDGAGQITAPAHTLYEIVRKLPEGADVELRYTGEESRLQVSAGRSNFKLPVLPAGAPLPAEPEGGLVQVGPPPLKTLYRRAAKRLHPDLAPDDAERARRERKMAEVNEAYEIGDRARLEALLLAAGESLVKVRGGDADAVLEWLRNAERAVQGRLRVVQAHTALLKNHTMHALGESIERAEKKGLDPLAIMANRLRAQITERRQELYIGQRLQPESSMAEAFLRQRQQRLGGGIAAV